MSNTPSSRVQFNINLSIKLGYIVGTCQYDVWNRENTKLYRAVCYCLAINTYVTLSTFILIELLNNGNKYRIDIQMRFVSEQRDKEEVK